MLFKKPEVADEIEFAGPKFHLREMNDLVNVSLTVAPIERHDNCCVPGSGRVSFPLILRKVVQRNRADPLALHYDLLGLRIRFLLRGRGSNGTKSRQLKVAEPSCLRMRGF
jgi:hypothetical protein